MACPCQEAQQRGRPLRDSPDGSRPDDPIRRCSPCKGHAIHGRLRLVLDHPGGSETIKPTLVDHHCLQKNNTRGIQSGQKVENGHIFDTSG